MKRIESSDIIPQIKYKQPIVITKDKIKFTEEYKQAVVQNELLNESMISSLAELSLVGREDKSFGEITVASVNDNSFLPEEIQKEITIIVNKIKECLSDNKEFYKKLINQCLKVGENYVYFDSVYNLLVENFPDIHSFEEGEQLIMLCHDIVDYNCFNKQIFKEKTKLELQQIRQEIKQLIYNI